ncbi:S8 family peptidase [Bacillus sp. EB600]|uniref:S8 family peptidase n=1 Tax=Bacillus sp. EB600 TaxID=2806345 RepID=UPI00210BE314|nr:S8 family peptidase [Bacillus sp. EB600]MCQ6281900.1 S8 family peptidase [Bacillus sp. EB600]
MFGYSMVQMVRAHAHKLDGSVREEILNLYKPFKRMPCFLHKFFENSIKKRKKLSLIIEFENSCHEVGRNQINDILKKHKNNRIKHEFPRVFCCSTEMTPTGLEEVLSSCSHIRRVYLNRDVRALLDVAVPSANAKNIVKNNTSLTGKGVTIAIVDTGIYPHQDLSGRIIGFKDFIKNKTAPYDDNGHGTHCAGDAAGNGAASKFKYAGPAPEANLIGVKVLNNNGSGSLETIMQGIEWCIQYNENNRLKKIDIISMSLGSTAQTYTNENEDPMVKIVEKAWTAGIVVCVAAGNDGPEARTISSPGISNQVITVGALDDRDTTGTNKDDDIASFSSRGPTLYGVTKPDIVAPGVNIVSLRSPKSSLDRQQKANRVGRYYFVLSGTSMATPICAGVVALIKQWKPDVSPQEVKDILKNGADLWRDRDPNTYGAGYINAGNSIRLL